jgi:hypothetical protein
VKRILSPVTNSAGLSAAALAVYAAAVMIYNAVHHHGVIDVPVIVAALAAVSALYARTKSTPVSDPRDGNGKPLVTANVILPASGTAGSVITTAPPPEAHP